MVTKKSRSRKTADKMAVYKASMKTGTGQGTRVSPARKSPRSKASKTRSDSSNHPSSDLSTRKKGAADAQDVVSEKKDEQGNVGASRLESAAVIPETPPREMQVVGRKRALAPQALSFGRDEDAGEESQMPSKKRKAFNTPPRDVEDPTLLPGTSDQMGSECQGIIDMELFDVGLHDGRTGPFSNGRNTSRNDDHSPELLSFRGARTLNARGRSTAPFQHNQRLEMIATSSQTISRMFESFRKKLIDEIQGLHRRQKSDLQEMNESLKTALLSEVRDMRGVVEILSMPSNKSSSGRSCSKTSLNEWEKKLVEFTPRCEVIFNKDLFSRILCFNTPLKVVEVYNGKYDTDIESASAAAQTLLFSLQPGAKKDNFSAGIEKLQSEFKYAVVQNTFFNVCKDTFDLFRSPLASDIRSSDDRCQTLGKGCRISRPVWLGVGYVTLDHINSACNFMESLNQSRRSKIRGTPGPDDIATHGALRVYRQLGSHLHKGRESLRLAFFQNLGFLFVKWEDLCKDNDQRGMHLSVNGEAEETGLSLDDVPCTELCSFAADTEKVNDVNAANKKLLKSLFSEWPGMVINVRHEVHVVSGCGAVRKHSGGKKMVLNRLINLIEVACDVVVEYTRIGSVEMYLRTHKTALKCIMVFALLIKEFTTEFISMYNAMSPVLPKVSDISVHGTCLKDFLPGRTAQESLLNSKCIRMNEREFELLNQDEDVGDTHSGTGHRPSSRVVFDETQIQESGELGVASI